MKVVETELPGVLIIEPPVHRDERGFFLETWHEARYGEEARLPRFVQDNLAGSRRDVLRGLHYQWPQPQAKLVSAPHGTILDVAVDIRRGSPTFRNWVAVELSEENRRQLYIPEGFAHGYVALTDGALCAYKCSRPYAPHYDRAIRWDDPDIGIDWPIAEPILSGKDAAAPRLADLPEDELPSVVQDEA